MIKSIQFLTFLLISNIIIGQTAKIDSLTVVLNKENNPKNKIAILYKLAEYCDVVDNLKYALPAIDLIKDLKSKTNDSVEVKKLNEQEGDMQAIFIYAYYFNPAYRDDSKLEACLNKGFENYKICNNWEKINDVINKQQNLYRKTGSAFKELEVLKSALSYAKSKDNKLLMAKYIYRIADFYSIIGDTAKTMEYANNGIELEKVINKPERRVRGYYLGAEIYSNINKNEKAIELYNKSLQAGLQTRDSVAIAANYLGIGEAYLNLKQFDLAKKSFNKALVYSDTSSVDNRTQYLRIIDGLGNLEYLCGNYNKAIEYHNLILTKYDPWKMPGALCTAQHKLAKDLFKLKKYSEAKKYEVQSLTWAKVWAGAKNVLQSEYLLYQIDSALSNYNGAFEHYKNYTKLKETLSLEEIKRATAKEDLQRRFDQQTLEAKLKQEEKDASTAAEIKQQKLIRNSFVVGFLFILVLAGVVLRSYLVKRKHSKELATKNQQILEQKHLVEEKHKEITDSINYAERIQKSFLATKELLDENLKDYFVFFQPKDVVSGDFYWACKLNNGQFALVTADSTGHGVPGAIMSLLNITSLEKAIEGKTSPSAILDETRKIIIERLRNDGSAEGGKDGMDCSFISFDFKNGKFKYAAANNSVWVVRGKDLLELDPDKMPVGKHDKDYVPFTEYEFESKKGDVIYTLTDGLPDQFGGPKGKKYMYKRLKDYLISISQDPMSIQKQKLNEELNNWKGNLEQVDDISVIGIRV